MKSFEECLAREEYNTESRKNAAVKHKRDRQLTREQRKQKRNKILYRTAVILWIIALVTVMAVKSAEIDKDSEPQAVVEEEAQDPAEDPDQMMEEEPPVIEEQEPVAEEPAEDVVEAEPVVEDPLAGANKIESCTITHYCTERRKHICGTGTGITASGAPVKAYVSCAVDPNVIPLGSTVIVDYGDGELHYYVAEDTGSSIKGNHIDLAVEKHKEAKELGVTQATVYWIAEG